MALSNFSISKAAAKDKSYKLNDGFGLVLLVEPSGQKFWRLSIGVEH